MSVVVTSDLWAEYERGRSDAARDALTEHYAAWCETVVAKFLWRRGRAFEVDAATSIGLEALAFRAIPNYDAAQGSFATYAGRVIRNACVDWLRRQPDPATCLEGFEPVAPLVVIDLEPCQQCDFTRLTAEASDLAAVVLWLRAFRSRSYDEIGETLHRSPASLRNLVSSTRRTLSRAGDVTLVPARA